VGRRGPAGHRSGFVDLGHKQATKRQMPIHSQCYSFESHGTAGTLAANRSDRSVGRLTVLSAQSLTKH
jgi:hypothetical protein